MIEQLQTHSFSSVYAMMGLPKEVKPLNVENLIVDVCEALNADRCLLSEQCRKVEVKFARWLIWAVLRSHGYGFTRCASMFMKDHTTVIHAMKNLPNDLKENEWLRIANNKLKNHYKQSKKSNHD